jgi:hypothetical protein
MHRECPHSGANPGPFLEEVAEHFKIKAGIYHHGSKWLQRPSSPFALAKSKSNKKKAIF